MECINSSHGEEADACAGDEEEDEQEMVEILHLV